MRLSLRLLLPLLAALPAGIASAQTPADSVRIGGSVDKPALFGGGDLKRFPATALDVTDRDGTVMHYEGVLLADLLRAAGGPVGEKLRGRYLAQFMVKVSGAAGDGAVFALPEVDTSFAERTIILAYRKDGRELGAYDGPYQLIVPGDKRHGRWVRKVVVVQVRRIEE